MLQASEQISEWTLCPSSRGNGIGEKSWLFAWPRCCFCVRPLLMSYLNASETWMTYVAWQFSLLFFGVVMQWANVQVCVRVRRECGGSRYQTAVSFTVYFSALLLLLCVGLRFNYVFWSEKCYGCLQKTAWILTVCCKCACVKLNFKHRFNSSLSVCFYLSFYFCFSLYYAIASVIHTYTYIYIYVAYITAYFAKTIYGNIE